MEIIFQQKEKTYLSKSLDSFLINISQTTRFVGTYFIEVFRSPFEWKEFGRQCYKIGCNSLPLISLTGFIIGIVFTKQSRPALTDFGATSWLPSLIGIAVIKTLAPLITALISSGKVGSSIGAELGAMKVTEQIDAMDVSASKPYKYLVVTRVTAATLMMPLLMLYTALVGLMGAYINILVNEHTTITTFVIEAFEKISFLDFSGSMIKATAYGFTIGMVACYKGFTTTLGTEGVGKAANMAVVTSMYIIFIEELVIVQVLGWFR
ncbi:MAG: ABC transporter permease [Chitinophagaceae bacterium]